MKVELNIVDKSILKSFETNNYQNVTNFISVINTILEPLETNSYYCISFNYTNQYDKEITAKLGYIYKNKNNSNSILITSNENYLEYYINKFSLQKIKIACIKRRGHCSKTNITIERESITMGDDCNPYDKIYTKDFSPEMTLYQICNENYSMKYYKNIQISYTKLEDNTEREIIFDINNIKDITLSEFIIDNNIDFSKKILIKKKKN